MGVRDLEKFELENGEVRLWVDGLMTVIEAEARQPGPGVFRLAADCGGSICSVGGMVPEEGMLRLKKRLSRAEKKRLGLESPSTFRILGEGEKTDATPEKAQEDSYRAEKPAAKAPAERHGWFEAMDSLPWQELRQPGSYFQDAALARATRDIPGVLGIREGEKQLLAIPMESDKPFPPLPVFRYGDPVVIGGKSYVLFRLLNGQLVD